MLSIIGPIEAQADTGVAAESEDGTKGNSGTVSVSAGSISIDSGGGPVKGFVPPSFGGSVDTDDNFAGISVQAEGSGSAGIVTVASAGALTVVSGGVITAQTFGSNEGGTAKVTAQGPLALSGLGSEIAASATPTASGNAGSVKVTAPQITITAGAEIASTTAGTGAGGSVDVTTPGALVLDGQSVAGTQIAASATGPNSGSGGPVTVAANTLTVLGGAQIASSTAGPGKGGDVDVTVASDITLPDRGPQITAQSTGSGDAGSITVSAVRLLISDRGAISTEAQTANGGNITLKVSDFLYLTNSQITTSVKGQTGNGGNITIDPQLVILNHSSIIAQAVEGHGGDITINAGLYVASTDSIVSASSQLGISGMALINGPQVDVNSALVALSSELHGLAAVSREACAARADQPVSSLTEAGRGGQPQDPEATLPALYIAGRDLNPTPASPGTTEASRAIQTTVRLRMRCG
jgi:large exoprotein involved in heme utilization and adhesion